MTDRYLQKRVWLRYALKDLDFGTLTALDGCDLLTPGESCDFTFAQVAEINEPLATADVTIQPFQAQRGRGVSSCAKRQAGVHVDDHRARLSNLLVVGANP